MAMLQTVESFHFVITDQHGFFCFYESEGVAQAMISCNNTYLNCFRRQVWIPVNCIHVRTQFLFFVHFATDVGNCLCQ